MTGPPLRSRDVLQNRLPPPVIHSWVHVSTIRCVRPAIVRCQMPLFKSSNYSTVSSVLHNNNQARKHARGTGRDEPQTLSRGTYFCLRNSACSITFAWGRLWVHTHPVEGWSLEESVEIKNYRDNCPRILWCGVTSNCRRGVGSYVRHIAGQACLLRWRPAASALALCSLPIFFPTLWAARHLHNVSNPSSTRSCSCSAGIAGGCCAEASPTNQAGHCRRS